MKTKFVDSDVLIIGGGMAGCGAAYEARYWGRNLKIVIAEKGQIERSGAVAMGLSAINCYMGMRWNENTPEDFVKYVRNDLMGLIREDLVFDIARHVDSTVHLFEEWGLPIVYDEQTKRYKREGRWQILIHGESYKPIVAEAATKAATEVYNRVMITHLLADAEDNNKIAGAAGIGVRDGAFYVFRAKAVIVAAGGATHVFRPRSVGEGAGRTWYSPWSTGSAYALLIAAGAEMTQMENKLVVTRFKDGYGPVGAWFLALKATASNAYGEDYELKYREEQRALYGNYVDAKPFPTCLRNDAMLREIKAGRSPIFIHTEKVLDTREKEELGHEDFLDMTMSQTIVWASQNIDPKKRPSELQPSEPYIMGSHATCSGAWASGPTDLSSGEYVWGYNRMTTVRGLFGAGDTIGGSAHKFSSGSFTEGRLAGKAAVAYIVEGATDKKPLIAPGKVESVRDEIFAPMETYKLGRNMITRGTVSPFYLYPDQGVVRLEKIMDEYVGGWGSYYTTNEVLLNRGLELLGMLNEDLAHLGAENLHQLQRAWELRHRVLTAEAVLRHTLYRKETRWPGYCYRSDFPGVDDKNWHVFVNSRRDPKTGDWSLFTRPYVQLVGVEGT
ncbi:MAG: adenylyl-sulfate reductase subunit alpha [Nitrososphaerota archaeon]|jgi:adenylylsulfate reductase subunit A|nr:adenylyl-sulfate reductase subunit alpha [Nitrososphaerota archaeon]MDG6903766.1 adenylyl-sulfate reductase subunit alpha [Nitrososphaerota archaeon]MDG6911601.1 adenylyl-sulfate reductase subunit alpha [Nitrososphaerota archaeon]MDG6940505.1 adenylyl-sulfate reductase subunit alpha [Nitrososphaerota archaeon]MDG6960816.1 adenylyl-sulfate reductase subunit alpha [Nitrososphaerota archaeon]